MKQHQLHQQQQQQQQPKRTNNSNNNNNDNISWGDQTANAANVNHWMVIVYELRDGIDAIHESGFESN